MIYTPLPFQAANVKRIERALQEHCIVADTSSTGIGKTYMALVACERLGLQPWVVCPLSILPEWARVVMPLGGKAIHYEGLVLPKHTPPWGWWKIKKRLFTWDLWETSDKPPCLIFDEAHRLSGLTSQSSKLLVAATREEVPTILLSATLADSPLKLRAVGAALGLCSWQWEQFEAWTILHGCFRDPTYNKLMFGGGKHHMSRIRASARGKITGINNASVPGFPKSVVVPIDVQTTIGSADLDIAYTEELEELEADAPTDLVAALRSRQLSEWHKLPAIIDMTRGWVSEGHNVVLFPLFKKSGEALAKKLRCAFISGDMKTWDREAQRDAFQANTSNVIVIQIGVTEGMGLHDLHGRPRIAVVFPTYDPVHFRQALGRCPRVGAKSSTVQYVPFADSSLVEAVLREKLQQKIKSIDTLNAADLAVRL